MEWPSIKPWLGVCLLATALGTGCNEPEVRQRRPIRSYLPTTVTLVPPGKNYGNANGSATTQAAKFAPAVQMNSSPSSVQANAVSANPVTSTPTPVAMLPPAIENDPPIQQTGLDETFPKMPALGQGVPGRRSFIDTTAQPGFSHAEDYSWLCGQVEHSRLSKGWRLRFASVDEVDRYGGSVTLVEDSRLSDLKDGDYVRVRGRMINPQEKGIAPPYQIDSIQPIEKKD